MSQKEAAEYVRCASVKAFYEWRRRRGIVVQNRLVARADIERALKTRKPRKPMAAASLDNLKLSPKRQAVAS